MNIQPVTGNKATKINDGKRRKLDSVNKKVLAYTNQLSDFSWNLQ